MKRLFAIILAAAMLAAVLCACGENKENKTSGNVTTTVTAKYDDGYAKQYASSATADQSGNTVYQFSGEKYDSYRASHNNTLSKNIQTEIAKNHDEKYGEYVYINEEKKAVIVGVHEKEYDEKVAKEEAAAASEYGFRYFQSLQTPVDIISVIYCNANNQDEIYGSFAFTASK